MSKKIQIKKGGIPSLPPAEEFPDDTIVEPTLGAFWELVSRIERLEHAISAAHDGSWLSPELLTTLRSQGVTRFKKGDVEVTMDPRAVATVVATDAPTSSDQEDPDERRYRELGQFDDDENLSGFRVNREAARELLAERQRQLGYTEEGE